MIPHSRPALGVEDFLHIRSILESGMIARGEIANSLERALAKRIGVRHAHAVSSGTAGLHLALTALGAGKTDKSDEVIVPSLACTALLNAVHHAGATPVLADVDTEKMNLTVETVRSVLTPRTKAIIATHAFGNPADVRGIAKLGVPMIEDCAQALGATMNGKQCGSIGSVGVFSFAATKMIAAGEGGAVCTSDRRLAGEIADRNDYDRRNDYRVRFNYKLSDLCAGVALSQLKKLDAFIAGRTILADHYREAFADLPVTFQRSLPNAIPCRYRFVIVTRRATKLREHLAAKEIRSAAAVHKPLHRYLGLTDKAFPGTAEIMRSAVSIPCYPALTLQERDRIVRAVRSFFRAGR